MWHAVVTQLRCFGKQINFKFEANAVSIFIILSQRKTALFKAHLFYLGPTQWKLQSLGWVDLGAELKSNFFSFLTHYKMTQWPPGQHGSLLATYATVAPYIDMSLTLFKTQVDTIVITGLLHTTLSFTSFISCACLTPSYKKGQAKDPYVQAMRPLGIYC